MAGSSKGTEDQGQADEAREKPVCGLIMPISAMPPQYDAGHWADVRSILEEAISAANMRPQMVSDSFESDVIQQRIIANIFNNPVVVCDVSGLNPNVMFELGMRLASKKATIIITDDIGNLPFDTRVIEHVLYPRNLRILETREFINDLTARVSRANQQVSQTGFRPFLDNFAGAESAEPSVAPITDSQYIKDQLESLQRQIGVLTRTNVSLPGDGSFPHSTRRQFSEPYRQYLFYVSNSQDEALETELRIAAIPGVLDTELKATSNRAASIRVKVAVSAEKEALEQIREIVGP